MARLKDVQVAIRAESGVPTASSTLWCFFGTTRGAARRSGQWTDAARESAGFTTRGAGAGVTGVRRRWRTSASALTGVRSEERGAGETGAGVRPLSI
jgi:hypothetical protein